MIEAEQGVSELRLPLSRRIVSGIGSVICMSVAFYGGLCAVDGTFRSLESRQLIPMEAQAYIEPLHTVVELVAPDVVTQWAAQHIEAGWRGIGEMAVGMFANWAFQPVGEGLCDEALSERP